MLSAYDCSAGESCSQLESAGESYLMLCSDTLKSGLHLVNILPDFQYQCQI